MTMSTSERRAADLSWLALSCMLGVFLALLMGGCADTPFDPVAMSAAKAGAAGAAEIDTLLVTPSHAVTQPGVPVQLCSFPRFRNGVVGMARVDVARCDAAYLMWVPDSLKGVSRKQQAVLDTLGQTVWGSTLDIVS